MKRTATVLLALFVASAVAQAGVKPGTKDTIKAKFEVRSGGTLYLNIDRGTVEIESSGNNMVYVEMERIVSGANAEDEKAILERHEYLMDQDGNNVIVESRFDDSDPGSWSWRRMRKKKKFRLKVTVRIPETYNVDFETGAGNVKIADLNGSVVGRTGAGTIIVGDISGPVDVSSGAGNIEIESVVGYVDVRSGAGNITIDEVAGEINAHTGAGNVVATVVGQPREDSHLNSGAGNVTVYLAEDIAVDVEATSSLGSASSEFGLTVKGKWLSKSFGGKINGGGPALTLHSGVGNVELRRY